MFVLASVPVESKKWTRTLERPFPSGSSRVRMSARWSSLKSPVSTRHAPAAIGRLLAPNCPDGSRHTFVALHPQPAGQVGAIVGAPATQAKRHAPADPGAPHVVVPLFGNVSQSSPESTTPLPHVSAVIVGKSVQSRNAATTINGSAEATFRKDLSSVERVVEILRPCDRA